MLKNITKMVKNTICKTHILNTIYRICPCLKKGQKREEITLFKKKNVYTDCLIIFKFWYTDRIVNVNIFNSLKLDC